MGQPRLEILMYHSISDGVGPTCIPPRIFGDQISAIADAGLPVVSLDDVLAARRGEAQLPPRSIIITFDDAFQDFADHAWPTLQRYGFPAINYVPTRHVGGHDVWERSGQSRMLMNWATIASLHRAGASFGSHTVNHDRLTRLSPAEVAEELSLSQEVLEEKLGVPVQHFAPPFGASNGAIRRQIASLYATSVGTALGTADARGDLYSLPRLEMFYFRHLDRWCDYLDGKGAAYLKRRKVLRAIGSIRNLVG